jgi:hypothetical protein
MYNLALFGDWPRDSIKRRFIMRRLALILNAVLLVLAASSMTYAADAVKENQAYRLKISLSRGQVLAKLHDKALDTQVADGPLVYRAARTKNGIVRNYSTLENAQVAIEGDSIAIRGQLAGLNVEQMFVLPTDRPVMEEFTAITNPASASAVAALSSLETGFTRQATDDQGRVLPTLQNDRFVAVPFRAKPVDLGNKYNDFSADELVHQPGSYVHVIPEQQHIDVPAPLRTADGWAWTHGLHTLGIFKFDQDNMQWSVLAPEKSGEKVAIRFGGVSMIDEEPSDLSRIQPGQTVKLGKTRYQTVAGGYEQASYAFRRFLDENGCRFPKNFDPPVHWEQLYDMEGAWNDRPHRFTKAILEKEAEKGAAYSCEALYLDPGWDSDFATFHWGDWLGPRKAFIDEMQTKYGLKVSLHTPLASWMSHPTLAFGGPSAPGTYPPESFRKVPLVDDPSIMPAPIQENGKRNLALLPDAKSAASSVYADGTNPLHTIAHLNDGLLGNRHSWISKQATGWAEIDLGAVYQISKIRLSNDAGRQFNDRLPVDYRILTATAYAADSDAAAWSVAAEMKDQPLVGVRAFDFPARDARFVRVQINKSAQTEPRLDEIEIYEDKPMSDTDAETWAANARRVSAPKVPYGVSKICLGSKAYLDDVAKRLLENCADGVVYLMFDGNWYQGGCDDPNHGHPVPFTREDHMRANLELARRIHEKYPRVLIEMHDMMMGGAIPRNTPVYYKYGLPGSYDLNWGFEMMWDSFGDIRCGRARSLYYYNLGCNVPIYLHINLRGDTPGCIVLWWYASTCRHLGIGGTSTNAEVIENQQQAMKWYKAHERFYKRGEFYGINEEIHFHVLPEENAFTVNVFNASDKEREIAGSIDLAALGLDPKLAYESAEGLGRVENGRLTINAKLPPWTAEPAAFEAKR